MAIGRWSVQYRFEGDTHAHTFLAQDEEQAVRHAAALFEKKGIIKVQVMDGCAPHMSGLEATKWLRDQSSAVAGG